MNNLNLSPRATSGLSSSSPPCPCSPPLPPEASVSDQQSGWRKSRAVSRCFSWTAPWGTASSCPRPRFWTPSAATVPHHQCPQTGHSRGWNWEFSTQNKHWNWVSRAIDCYSYQIFFCDVIVSLGPESSATGRTAQGLIVTDIGAQCLRPGCGENLYCSGKKAETHD